MSLTDYERYMNAEDGTPEKSEYLKAHVASVRAQVKRLARKEYTKYLPEGYNRLNFAIMYVPIEGALNLAQSESVIAVLVHIVVEQRRDGVVRRGDGMEVAGEV